MLTVVSFAVNRQFHNCRFQTELLAAFISKFSESAINKQVSLKTFSDPLILNVTTTISSRRHVVVGTLLRKFLKHSLSLNYIYKLWIQLKSFPMNCTAFLIGFDYVFRKLFYILGYINYNFVEGINLI